MKVIVSKNEDVFFVVSSINKVDICPTTEALLDAITGKKNSSCSIRINEVNVGEYNTIDEAKKELRNIIEFVVRGESNSAYYVGKGREYV